MDVEKIARKKHKFDDNAYLEESREINDNVRSAVSAGRFLDIPLLIELMGRSTKEDEEEEGCYRS